LAEKVFEVKYECGNCGKKFSKAYSENIRIKESSLGVEKRMRLLAVCPLGNLLVVQTVSCRKI